MRTTDKARNHKIIETWNFVFMSKNFLELVESVFKFGP